MADEDVLVSDKKGRTARGEDGARRKGGTNDDVAVDGDDVAIDVPNDSVVNLADLPSDIKRGGGDTSSLEVNMEEEDREKDFTEEKKRKRRKSRKATVAPEAETAAKMEGEGDGASTEDINRNRKSREEKGQSRSKRSSRAGVPDSSSTNRKYRQRTSGVGASTVTQHKPRRIRIKKESLSDLPQTVWRLLHNMRVLIVMFGAVLGGFYFNGYLATLPEYMHVQFQRSWGTSLILAGATGPLAWGMGTQLGGVLMFRFRSVPLVRVTLGVVVCIFTCCTLTLLSMVFHCQHDTSPNSTMTAYCGKWCECDSYMVQYEPLCGSDHKTYPSPCHAGCTAIERTSTVGLFKFTGCECVGGGYALQGACVPQCSHLAGFVVITFVAVLTASVGIVPAFTLLFRSVRSRSKSFAVGFAIWVVYTLSQTLGPVAFTYPRDGRCRHWGEDCLEENVCWSYDLQPYRLMVNGLAAAFLFASAVTFLLVYWHLKRSRARRLKQEAASQVMKLEQLENAVTTAENAPIDDVPMNTISEDVTTHSVPDVVTSVSPTIVSSINL